MRASTQVLARAPQTRKKRAMTGASSRRAAAVAAVVALDLTAFWACQEQDPRPPRMGCVENCPNSPISGVGGTNSNLDTGLSDVPLDATATLTGTVQAFAGEDFSNTVAFQAVAEVRGETASGSEVSTNWDGSNPFELAGVRAGRDVWVSVLPSLPALEVMPTLLQVDTTRIDPVALRLVRGLTLDTIYGVFTAPTTRIAGAGHVVVRFLEDTAQPAPVAGVRVALQGVEVIAYDAGGTFSDAEPERGTGPLGLAVLANVQAVPLPGADHTVTLSGTVSESVKLRIAADAATYVEVRLSP
jgi:hypothetical protein